MVSQYEFLEGSDDPVDISTLPPIRNTSPAYCSNPKLDDERREREKQIQREAEQRRFDQQQAEEYLQVRRDLLKPRIDLEE